jgi:hypothetical protein
MKRQTLITQKRRGPAPTGKGTLIGVRVQPDRLTVIDAWIKAQEDTPSRPEAIRRLMAMGLASSPRSGHHSQKAAAKASQIAGREIDRLVDQSVPAEERASRKRRLLKGPKEFRDLRTDHPKVR